MKINATFPANIVDSDQTALEFQSGFRRGHPAHPQDMISAICVSMRHLCTTDFPLIKYGWHPIMASNRCID